MEYLHELDPPVLHRDLKSANVLIAAGGRRLAIADFGLARYQAKGGKMTAETGSYRWMAPEVIRHEEYDKRCDVYSFAILAWEMLTYRIPFEKLMPVEAAFAVAKEAKRPPIPPEWSELPIAEMLRACWCQDAKKRPPFSAICVALEEEIGLLTQSASHNRPLSDLPPPANGDASMADVEPVSCELPVGDAPVDSRA
jgi:serine/threonine protein kinase